MTRADPPPAAACWHDATATGVALHADGPNRDDLLTRFDRDHPDGQDGHRRVKRLPKQKGDPKQ